MIPFVDMEEIAWHHYAIELLLVVAVGFLVSQKSYRPTKKSKMSKEEEEEVLEAWNPDPLVSGIVEDLNQPPVCEGTVGRTVKINGVDVLNFASYNFLGFSDDKDVEEVSVAAVRKYGVGSCGPRGFYGTIDVHVQLEEEVAKFMNVEEAILYSYGFSTIASVIPAYSKRGDVIFCDKGVNSAIQQGLVASRSNVMFFEHNDMKDLERLLQKQAATDKENPKKAMATRRFIIAEGLYVNYGDICPLKELVKFKYEHKCRIFLDETMSFGVLGKTGRGVTEHFGIPIGEVDLISVSMGASLGSIGGFCIGRSFLVDHQRLSGQGYCFSASLPPLLACAALKSLSKLGSEDLVPKLQSRVAKLRATLNGIDGLEAKAAAESPLVHLYLTKYTDPEAAVEDDILQQIVNKALQGGVALTRAKYIRAVEAYPPRPSIRLSVSAKHSDEDISKLGEVIRAAVDSTFKHLVRNTSL